MRNIQVRGVFVAMLAMVAACGLEPEDEGAASEAAGAQPGQIDEPGQTGETGEALTPTGDGPIVQATPTCNTSNIDGGANQVVIEIPWYSSSSQETSSCNLVRGTNSLAVRQLQESLNTCYGKGLVLDGDFGGNTQTALKQVQSLEHISADGQYGPQTRDNICHVIINGGGCRHRNEIGNSRCPR